METGRLAVGSVEELHQQVVHLGRPVGLDPVGRLLEPLDAEVRHPLLQPFGEPRRERDVVHPPDEERLGSYLAARRDPLGVGLASRDQLVRELTERPPTSRAVVVDRRGERAGSRERRLVPFDVTVAERPREGVLAHRRLHEPVVPETEREFREEGKLEEEGVPGASQLVGRPKLALERLRVWRVQDREPIDHLGMARREFPRDHPAPVVTDDVGPVVHPLDQVPDIPHEFADPVAREARGFLRSVVAPEVGRDDTESGVGERGDLLAPGVPELGEAVETEDERAVAGLHVVQSDAVCDRLVVVPRSLDRAVSDRSFVHIHSSAARRIGVPTTGPVLPPHVPRPHMTRGDRVTVVGAGAMGGGLATHFALCDRPVALVDHRESNLEDARRRIEDAIDVLRETGVTEREAGEVLAGIEFTLELGDAVEESELVLETVSEDLAIKHAVFERIGEAAPDDAILASNTSSIPITRIAAGVPDHADRVVGCHWWYPPYLLDPVEVVRGEETSEETVERTREFVESVGKESILVERDVPGFVWNRVQFAVVRECLHIVEEGVASAEDVNRAIRDGYARRTSVIGPLETVDLAGLDLFRTIAADLYPELSSPAEPNPILDERLEEGRNGVESGAGIFEYDRSAESVARARDERLAALARLHSGFGSEEEP